MNVTRGATSCSMFFLQQSILWVSRIQGVPAKATDDLSRTRKYVVFNNGFVERREQVDATHRGVQEQTMNDLTFNSSSEA